jgi:peptide/nickel transport system permease protein
LINLAGLRRYILIRSVQIIIVLLIVATLNFFLPRMAGDPIKFIAGEWTSDMTDEELQQLRAVYGLDKPLWEQYGVYLSSLLRGDFGVSFNFHRPVLEIIGDRMVPTVILVFTFVVLSFVIGTILGVYGAWNRGGSVDKFVLSTSVVFNAIPAFWLGFILLLVFSFHFSFFPLYGMGGIGKTGIEYVVDVLWHAMLPIITLTLVHFDNYAIITRNTVVTILGEDFILAAKASGIPQRIILFKHVLRNAMLPLITYTGGHVGRYFSSIVLVETLFGWTGIGYLIVQSARQLDFPLIQGVFFIIAVITLLSNFVADISYAYIDPRVKLK